MALYHLGEVDQPNWLSMLIQKQHNIQDTQRSDGQDALEGSVGKIQLELEATAPPVMTEDVISWLDEQHQLLLEDVHFFLRQQKQQLVQHQECLQSHLTNQAYADEPSSADAADLPQQRIPSRKRITGFVWFITRLVSHQDLRNTRGVARYL